MPGGPDQQSSPAHTFLFTCEKAVICIILILWMNIMFYFHFKPEKSCKALKLIWSGTPRAPPSTHPCLLQVPSVWNRLCGSNMYQLKRNRWCVSKLKFVFFTSEFPDQCFVLSVFLKLRSIWASYVKDLTRWIVAVLVIVPVTSCNFLLLPASRCYILRFFYVRHPYLKFGSATDFCLKRY